MANVKFNLKSKKNEESLIMLRLLTPRGRLNYSTGITVPVKYWNSRQQRIRDTEEYPDGMELQYDLDQMAATVRKLDMEFRRKEVIPSVHEFKRRLNMALKGMDYNEEVSFSSYLDRFIERRSRLFKPETVKVYVTLRKHFSNYAGKDVHFDDLTRPLLMGFIEYLLGLTFADNHIHKIVSTLKTVLNEATEHGVNSNMAYKSRYFRVPKRDADNIYLPEEEILAIYHLNLSEKSSLEATRDLFVVGCYTGLRYSDFSVLTRDNLRKLSNGMDAFRVITEKTDEILWIPLHGIVREVLEKYDYSLPTGVSNQLMNRHLKVIAKEVGLNAIYQKRVFRANQAEIQRKERWELVCTHTARRSFASNAFRAGIPAQSIMKITGHKKMETFMKYISLSKQEHAELMSENPFFQ